MRLHDDFYFGLLVGTVIILTLFGVAAVSYEQGQKSCPKCVKVEVGK